MEVIQVVHVTRVCPRCEEEKSTEDFYRRDRRPSDQCKECIRSARRAYYRENAEELRAKRRARHDPAQNRASRIRRLYGITVEQYDAMLAAQAGRCAICQSEDPGRGENFHVDHDHTTGEVRGLLCQTCNVGIGALGDDPDRLFAAWAYLVGPTPEGSAWARM